MTTETTHTVDVNERIMDAIAERLKFTDATAGAIIIGLKSGEAFSFGIGADSKDQHVLCWDSTDNPFIECPGFSGFDCGDHTVVIRNSEIAYAIVKH